MIIFYLQDSMSRIAKKKVSEYMTYSYYSFLGVTSSQF